MSGRECRATFATSVPRSRATASTATVSSRARAAAQCHSPRLNCGPSKPSCRARWRATRGAPSFHRELGILAVTADVGGTTFDTCLISGYEPQVKYEGRVAGMPLQSTWVDVRSDRRRRWPPVALPRTGSSTFGPRSAGADPGPVCHSAGRDGADCDRRGGETRVCLRSASSPVAVRLDLDVRPARRLPPLPRALTSTSTGRRRV